MIFTHMLGYLDERDVGPLFDQCQKLLGQGFDPVRALVPALRARGNTARPPKTFNPLDRSRRRNTKTLSRCPP